jgi:hypothetical protein
MTAQILHVEEHPITGEKLLAKVKDLVREGNARRIIIKNHDGVTLMEVPLTVGLVGAVLEPLWVALGAIAALAAHYRIAVVREPAPAPAEPAMREAAATGRAFHARADV